MRLSRQDADIFVPDGAPMPEALRRATHVCVGTHQDDQEFMAFHGIAECFGRKDRGFAGVVVTNGAGSSRTDIYADYTNEDMVRVRVKEQRKAAVVGEYACQVQLMHPSADVKKAGHPGVLADLAGRLRDRPAAGAVPPQPGRQARHPRGLLPPDDRGDPLPPEGPAAEAGPRLRDLARPRLAERRRQAGPARWTASRTWPRRSPASTTRRSPAASATTWRWPGAARPRELLRVARHRQGGRAQLRDGPDAARGGRDARRARLHARLPAALRERGAGPLRPAG